MKELQISPGSSAFSIIDGVLFDNFTQTLVYYPAWKKQTSYTISQRIHAIGDHAFFGCGNLTSVTLPQSLTKIAPDAFAYCNSLVSVVVPRKSYAAKYCWKHNLPITYEGEHNGFALALTKIAQTVRGWLKKAKQAHDKSNKMIYKKERWR